MTRPKPKPQHRGLETETQLTKASTGFRPGAEETQAQLRAPRCNPIHPHTPSPHPVFQGLQVELITDTG